MTLRFYTAHASYFGDDRVDITRSGCNGLLNERKEAPGICFAPSPDLVYPVVTKIFPGAFALMRCKIDGRPDEARNKVGHNLLAATWEAYKEWFRAEMRVSYGALERRQYGPLEQLAEKRGVRPAHDKWTWWLDQETATFVCECTFKLTSGEPVCHRYIVAEILEKLGAVYEGERGTK